VAVNEVYWLEQSEQDLPRSDDWLNPSELVRVNAMRVPKRRNDWRLGRWAAKCAIASYLNLPAEPQHFASIEVHPAWSGAPEVSIANAAAPLTISISHREGTALCAVAALGVELGCDLEIVEPREESFVRDYFTAEEQEMIKHASPSQRWRAITLFWSAKESFLKALREGLRLDTRSVVISSETEGTDANDWRPLSARCVDGHTFKGWWRESHGVIRTVVMDPPPNPPVRLQFRSGH
jgi:4'-phosphopantetheinyl transferase